MILFFIDLDEKLCKTAGIFSVAVNCVSFNMKRTCFSRMIPLSCLARSKNLNKLDLLSDYTFTMSAMDMFCGSCLSK